MMNSTLVGFAHAIAETYPAFVGAAAYISGSAAERSWMKAFLGTTMLSSTAGGGSAALARVCLLRGFNATWEETITYVGLRTLWLVGQVMQIGLLYCTCEIVAARILGNP